MKRKIGEVFLRIRSDKMMILIKKHRRMNLFHHFVRQQIFFAACRN